jgi:hypothetical protein
MPRTASGEACGFYTVEAALGFDRVGDAGRWREDENSEIEVLGVGHETVLSTKFICWEQSARTSVGIGCHPRLR